MGDPISFTNTEVARSSVSQLSELKSRQAIHYGGLRALMLAVFEDGVRCFLGTSPTLAAEAEAWVFGRPSPNPFCFPVLCEVLGLDPSATREALLAMRRLGTLRPAKLPRVRHNVRSAFRVRPRRIRSRKNKALAARAETVRR